MAPKKLVGKDVEEWVRSNNSMTKRKSSIIPRWFEDFDTISRFAKEFPI